MDKMNIVEWILNRLGIAPNDTMNMQLNDMVLAIDNHKTATYKLEDLLPTLHKNNQFYKYDVVPYFYNCLVTCWFMGYIDFSNFSWGIYKNEEGLINTLPLHVRSAFNPNWYDFKYKYKSISPEPETMVFVAKDTDYIKQLFEMYGKVSRLVDESVKDGAMLFLDRLSVFDSCISFLRSKLHSVEVVLFDGVLFSRDFSVFAAKTNDNLYNAISTGNKSVVFEQFDKMQLLGYFKQFYAIE